MMKPWVQGKPSAERSHPPLNRINDWLFGGPSQYTAVTGAANNPASRTMEHTIFRVYPGILFMYFS
jgi:hypothetical protein